MRYGYSKIASVLAFVIGAMAIFAGAPVLLGRDPGYYVIGWLPLYNYTAGILTVFIAAVLIWTRSRFAGAIAAGIFGLHAMVMAILLTAYNEVVAPDSLVAMTIRLVVWLIILVLMFLQTRQARQAR